MTDENTQRLVKRLIDAWDDDLGELLKLVELIAGIRRRAMAFERELCARIADDVARSTNVPSGVGAALEIAKRIRGRTGEETQAAVSPPWDETRCRICGWPLADTWENGCTPGNCSMRPRACQGARTGSKSAADVIVY